jgi:hypothetical protein
MRDSGREATETLQSRMPAARPMTQLPAGRSPFSLPTSRARRACSASSVTVTRPSSHRTGNSCGRHSHVTGVHRRYERKASGRDRTGADRPDGEA